MELAALVVSIVVAIGSLLGWLDGRRRIKQLSRRTAIRFQIEPELKYDAFLLRNVGDKTAWSPSIDGNSVKGNALSWATSAHTLEPNESFTFRIAADENGDLPDTIRVTWTGPFKGDQVVVMPRDTPPTAS